jgi:hypothetical protein
MSLILDLQIVKDPSISRLSFLLVLHSTSLSLSYTRAIVHTLPDTQL